MEAIDGRFQKICLESIIMGMVRVSEPDQGAQVKETTGTAEDLKRALDGMVKETDCAAK